MTNNNKKTPANKEKNVYESLQELRDELQHEAKNLLSEIARFGYARIEEFAITTPDGEMDQADLSQFIELQHKCRDHVERQEKIDNIVILDSAKLPEAVASAEKILIKNSKKHNIYQRSGKLVRASKSSSDKAILKRSPDACIIREIDQAFLTLFLNQVAQYMQYSVQKKEYRQVACREHIARYLLSKQEWDLPHLHGIINAPTLRNDGSILDEPGYDFKSGLLFFTDEYEFEKIPTHPTKNDAEKAADKLLNILQEFPFENEVSRSVALAAILTALVRRSIATAPLFGFTAPKMGSGKTLLADVVSLIATGKPNSVVSQAENETEEKKRLLGILMEGDPIICYDNIERPFGGATLCAILTQEEYKDRKLGGNETRTVPTHATFLVTGNNLAFIGDTSTRTLLCKLDPQVERPEERTFEIENLRTFIIEHRSELVCAAITILRAYDAAGKPPLGIRQFGRFEEWGERVRSAIVWLGFDDPCESRKEIEDADPVRILLGALFHSWYVLFEGRGVKAKEIISVIKSESQEYDSDAVEQLRDTLTELAGNNKGEIDTRKFSGKLRSYKNRIEKGYRLEQMGTSQGTTLWSVKKIDA